MTKEWGQPIWFFFHTLAEKITNDGYSLLKNDICNIISSICNCLPCPDCTKHAKQYTKYTLNPKILNTKEKLQMYLFKFHNDVNKRLHKSEFKDYDKYKSANMRLIYQYFKGTYFKYNDPTRGFVQTMVRERIIQRTDKFFIENHKYFN